MNVAEVHRVPAVRSRVLLRAVRAGADHLPAVQVREEGHRSRLHVLGVLPCILGRGGRFTRT